MSDRAKLVLRLLNILHNLPAFGISEEWLRIFRCWMQLPEDSYPWGTFSTDQYRDCVYFSPDQLISWLGAEGYLTEDELLLLDAELLLEAAG